MKQRRRIYYSAAQRNRWQAGEPMSAIGRRFDRESSSVFSVISPTGGIRPPDRRRSKQTLSLSEREEISRWLSMRCSLRSIATHLGRSASTISREVHRNGGSDCTEISASPEIMIAVAAERTRHIKLGTENILSGLGQPSADLQARRSSLAQAAQPTGHPSRMRETGADAADDEDLHALGPSNPPESPSQATDLCFRNSIISYYKMTTPGHSPRRAERV
jgi:DNA-binding CsgD family transcriptional regulator